MSTVVVRLGTQPFIILCRMFDGFYDDLKQQNEVDALTESIAQSLLAGVQHLQEQAQPPKELALELTYPEVFFLSKLVNQVIQQLPDTDEQKRVLGWLEECRSALSIQ